MLRLVQPHFESALAVAERLASKPEPLCAPSGCAICSRAAARAPHGKGSRTSLPRPIGVCRRRECGNQQPSHVISSSLHVVHVVHANDAQQQAAGAPIVASRPASALPSIEPRLATDADTAILVLVSIGAA